MRAGAVAVVALVAALVGGVAALALADASGLLASGGGERTVLVPAPSSTPPPRNVANTPDPALGNGFDPAAIYSSRSPGVVTVYAFFGAGATGAHASQGSGFVVSDDGYILTSSHVITNAGGRSDDVRGAQTLFVEFADRDRVPARIVGWDLFNDVGLVKVEPSAHPLTPVPLGDSSQVLVGEPVAAIGAPFGNQNSLAVGVVSATGRSIPSLTSDYDVAHAIQVDAPINRGNSGGPVFDARGRVIGISAQIRSESGNAEGVGFAVPINSAKRTMAQLVATGRVRYAYIGITTQDVTPSLARRFGFATRRGALIIDSLPDRPAARAGLRGGEDERLVNGVRVTIGGDVIVAIAGERVETAEDVARIVTDRLLPGQVVPITVYRGGKERAVVRVRLAERPPDPARP